MKQKKERMFLGILFLVLVVFCLVFYFFRGQMGAQVKVTVDGVLYDTYPLEKEQEIAIEKDGVVTNRLVIRDGVADMIEADCPDKLCVHQKAISKTGETIVCLPNKVVAEIIGSEESELDSVAK